MAPTPSTELRLDILHRPSISASKILGNLAMLFFIRTLLLSVPTKNTYCSGKLMIWNFVSLKPDWTWKRLQSQLNLHQMRQVIITFFLAKPKTPPKKTHTMNPSPKKTIFFHYFHKGYSFKTDKHIRASFLTLLDTIGKISEQGNDLTKDRWLDSSFFLGKNNYLLYSKKILNTP